MADLNFREILVKEPFKEIIPKPFASQQLYKIGHDVIEPEDNNLFRVITQSDFLRQYYPSGHKINDTFYYPDVYREDPDNQGKFYIQPVTRVAFAFQRIIATKQVVHIIGNDVQFELAGKTEDEEKEKEKQTLLLDYKQGWINLNMEQRFYEAVNSIKITGDAAIIFYFDHRNTPKAKTLSFINGDKLYPHYNEDGELYLFARKYYAYNEDGKASTEYVEVWDDTYLYKAKKGLSKADKAINIIKDAFGLSGYEIFYKEKHGFNKVPIVYYRDNDGACWLPSQDTIEQYEQSVSYFCENNKANAFPIFYSKGEGVDIHGDMNGSVKAITINDPSGEIGFLSHNDVSTSFNTQLTLLYNMIYEQCFAVKPPELKSGDLPSVALKLLYSPAIEKATHDANALQPFIEELMYFVKYAHGLHINKQATLIALDINAWIEPYVHQNVTELITNLSMAVQNKFLSHQTASERISNYAKNDEIERIIREAKELQKQQMQTQIDTQRAQMQEQYHLQEKLLKLNKGSDVNTSRKHIRTTDENGNHPNENNWNDWNNKII